MRICIFGAGAVGGFLAARLAHGGREVSLVTRGAHLEAIRRDGLRLVAGDGEILTRPAASDDPAALGTQDLVIVAAKTPSLGDVARAMAPLLHERTAVAFAVNGVFWFYGDGFAPGGLAPDTARLDRDGALHRLIGPARTLGMVINSPNQVIAPGVVRNDAAENAFVLGEALPEGTRAAPDRAPEIAAALSGCGFACRPSASIRRDMWMKLIRNSASSPLCSLTGCDVATAYGDDAVRALAVALMRETLSVAIAHGFDDLPADPENDVRPGMKLHHKPSMLQDLERGRPMEIDSQLAAVRDLGRQAGLAMPVMETVLALLMRRAREAGCY